MIIPLCMGISTMAGAATHTVSPSQSLGAAVAQLQPGDTLIVKGGTYREAIILPARSWSADKPTTIMGATGERAVIKASDVVRDWSSRGNGVWMKQGWTVNSQQVFVNGQVLQQIGGTVFGNYSVPNCNQGYYTCGDYVAQTGGIWPGRINGDQNSLRENSFYYDQVAKTLYVKVPANIDLNAQTVEVSVRPFTLFGQGIRGLTLRNLNFEHGNASAASRGSVVTLNNSHNNIIDNISIVYSDSYGLIVHGNDNIIRNSRISYAGETGIGGSGERTKIIDNEVSYNNYRGFHEDWDAGGTKFIWNGGIAGAPNGLKNSEIANNRFIFNKGPGLWFDYSDGGNRTHDNIVAYNSTAGIFVEVTNGDSVYNNYVFGNGRQGIFYSGSNNGLIAHNLSAFNGWANFSVTHRPPDSANNRVIGNVGAWGGRFAQLWFSASLRGNNANHNLYLTQDQPVFIRGVYGNFATGLSQWRTVSGQDTASWSEISAPLAGIQTAINEKRVDINWRDIFALAERYGVPPISDSIVDLQAYRPGPVLPTALLPPSGLSITTSGRSTERQHDALRR